MKNMKKIYLLGAALIVVLVLIILFENAGSGKRSTKEKLFFPGLEKEHISSFQIAGKDDTVKVFRKGDIWKVNRSRTKQKSERQKPLAGLPSDKTPKDEKQHDVKQSKQSGYRADTAKVSKVLQKLVEMKKDILISKNPEKQEIFEVDSANGVGVKVWNRDNESIATFIIGKSGPDWRHQYVRLLGTNNVWAVGGSIKGAFSAEMKQWRNKSIVEFDPLHVKQLAIQYTDTAEDKKVKLKAEKMIDAEGNAKWMLSEPEKAQAKKEKIATILDNFSKLETVDWDTTTADSLKGFDEPKLSVAVVLDNGEKESIIVGDEKESSGKLFVKAEGETQTFIVYKSNINFYKKTFNELRQETGEAQKEKKEGEKLPAES